MKKNRGMLFIFWFLIFSLSMAAYTAPCYAGFEFDHEREVERRNKETTEKYKDDQMKFLDYPKDCFLKGNYEETYNTCQKLLNHPRAQKVKGDALYLMGLSCLKMNRFLEARNHFNDIILIESAKDDLKRDASMGLADSYALEGSFDKAYELYNQILTRYPSRDIACVVYYRLAEALEKMGRADEAKNYIDKIRVEFPLSFEAQLSNSLLEKPAESDEEVTYSYNVQVGCFNEKDNADKFCAKLASEGFEAYIMESEGGNEPQYRVKVGRFASKEDAEVLEKKLKRAGYSTKIYP